MLKISPMKNSKTHNINKKDNYTFTKNQKRREQDENHREELRKNKLNNRFSAWAAE